MIAERELNSLYYDKWRKLLKSRRDLDLDLDRTMPNVKLFLAVLNILPLIKPQLQKEFQTMFFSNNHKYPENIFMLKILKVHIY